MQKQLLMFVICLCLMACTITPNPVPQMIQQTETSEEFPEVLPTARPRPDYIADVSPPESSITLLTAYQHNLDPTMIFEGVRFEDRGYNSSICVVVDVGPLLEEGDRLDHTGQVLGRISIFVNEIELTEVLTVNWLDISSNNVSVDHASGSGWSVFCWRADVEEGIHQVTFQFQKTSGEIEEDGWYFAVVDDSE